MIVSKTRNANGWVTQRGNVLPNGVKCNEKCNWVSVLRLKTGRLNKYESIPLNIGV